MTTVGILNGPNLNLLGSREPEIYGYETLDDIHTRCRDLGKTLGLTVSPHQSNDEGALVTLIQQARADWDAIIINAGAYTHTSVAIHDALRAFEGVIIELHLSNPHQRETFRHLSYITPVADCVIAGFGAGGYDAALRLATTLIAETKK